MVNMGGTAEVIDCLFIGNEAPEWDGGGMMNLWCELIHYFCIPMQSFLHPLHTKSNHFLNNLMYFLMLSELNWILH